MSRSDRSFDELTQTRRLAHSLCTRVGGNRGNLADMQQMVDSGDLETLMSLANSSFPEVAESALEAAAWLFEYPMLKDIWSHFNHQHLFKLCKSLTNRATSRCALTMLACYIAACPGAEVELVKERILDALLKWEPNRDGKEVDMVSEVKAFQRVVKSIRLEGLPVWTALRGKRGHELADLLLGRIGRGSDKGCEEGRDFAFSVFCTLKQHPEVAAALVSARTVNNLVQVAGRPEPKEAGAVKYALQVLAIAFQNSPRTFLQTASAESIWKLSVMRLESTDDELNKAALAVLVHAASTPSGQANMLKLGLLPKVARFVPSSDGLLSIQALLVLQKLEAFWPTANKAVCNQMLKEEALHHTLEVLKVLLQEAPAGSDISSLDIYRRQVAAALPQARRPWDVQQDPAPIQRGCAAGWALSAMLGSNHFVKQLQKTGFEEVTFALLQAQVAPQLAVSLIADRLANAVPADTEGNGLCTMLQSAGILERLFTWLRPPVDVCNSPEVSVVLQALAGMSKMDAFDRNGETYSLRAAVHALVEQAKQPKHGLTVFRILRRVLRTTEQMEMLRDRGALEWFRVCLKKDEADKFESALPPMERVPE